MRAILIDPETRTLSEIQINCCDDDEDNSYKELVAIIHKDKPEPKNVERTGERIWGGIELNRDKAGYDSLVIDNESEDGPGYILDGKDDDYPFVGRAIVMRYTPFGDTPQVVVDAQISIEELTRRITFAEERSRS